MQRSGFIWAELLPTAARKRKKKKRGERIKGYDCRKCHPKPGKRESTGGWRHYLNEPSSWAIARKRKGGKKGRTLHGQWPETLLTALCYIKTKKGDEDRRHVCVSTSVSDGRRPVRWGRLMLASRLCPAENTQPTQRPNTDVSLQPQWIVVTRHE